MPDKNANAVVISTTHVARGRRVSAGAGASSARKPAKRAGASKAPKALGEGHGPARTWSVEEEGLYTLTSQGGRTEMTHGGRVVWRGRATRDGWETTSTTLSPPKVESLLGLAINGEKATFGRHAYGAPASGSAAKKTAHRKPAKKTAAKKTAKKAPKAPKKTAAKKTARKANKAAKTSKASKGSSKAGKGTKHFVKIIAGGEPLHVYGPFSAKKAGEFATKKAADFQAQSHEPGFMVAKAVTATGKEAEALALAAKATKPAKKAPASKRGKAAKKKKAPASKKPASKAPKSSKPKSAKPKSSKPKSSKKAPASKKPASKAPKSSRKAPASKKPASKKAPPSEKPKSAKRAPASRKPASQKPASSKKAPASGARPSQRARPVDEKKVLAELKKYAKKKYGDAGEHVFKQLEHIWHNGGREKTLAWMAAHPGYRSPARGFEAWFDQNEAEAMALLPPAA